MSEEPGRITRRFLTTPMHDVHALLRGRMEAMGMTVRVDAVGNLRGLWQPHDAGSQRLLMGSHIDTVPNAGPYDGVLGVVMALEWVEIARELKLPLAIEVIAFSEEEGVRFGVPFIGSRAVAGRFDKALLDRKDSNGITLEAAIRRFGLDPHLIGEAALDGSALGFVEIHIEQGPILESEELNVAVVTGIVGQTRLILEFTGQANHAGTTPMRMRHDALAAAAEWITQVESLALATDGLVATVGKVSVEPNAANVVPGAAVVSIDIRHAHDANRASAVKKLIEYANAIAERRGLALQSTGQLDQPAVPMDERLTSFLADAIEAAGMPVKQMPSGAGHDAMVMATRVPTAMLFLRSPGGLSHHPAEAVLEEDVEAALHVGSEFLERVAAQIS
ncbi:MAG TPA: allantoate amidohydrolase [Terracidiphilus sp.]|nr:allantoate amidohydrolase [Terracidiphilus sp.]